MRIRLLAGVLGTALALIPAAAQAQTSTAAPAAPVAAGDSRGDVDIAVTPVDSLRDRGVSITYRGWEAGVSYHVFTAISIYGEGTGEYRSSGGFTSAIYVYGGGARFESSRRRRIRPFAQVFLGSGLDNGRTTKAAVENHYPVLAPGGGVDLAAASHLAVRLRLDFPLYMNFGPDVYKGARVSLGIVVPYGRR